MILGMGPCGLGAAWRLEELGYRNYKMFERSTQPGGLASSFVDDNGFTWDIGSHVGYSHYSYYDNVLSALLEPGEWIHHQRSSWIWMRGKFIPYPFQNNLRHLPKKEFTKCIEGLLAARRSRRSPENFAQWIHDRFGDGISESFMLPYNRKVWAYPLEELSFDWIGERVAIPDPVKILRDSELKVDDADWGADSRFLYPLKGCSGEVWKRAQARLGPGHSFFEFEVKHVNTRERAVSFANGVTEPYDVLISTIPLDRLLASSDHPGGQAAARLFKHSSTHIVGLGIEGRLPEQLAGKSWIYYPEPDVPFHRVSVFSNYSPNNVPDARRFWSLMAEVSETPVQPVDRSTIPEQVIEGMIRCSLIDSTSTLASAWYRHEPYAYPTPFLGRKEALEANRTLESAAVYSRGRFGGWKYEVSNQDHSFMQGVEVVDRLLTGRTEHTFVC